jgi:hypothetical protein
MFPPLIYGLYILQGIWWVLEIKIAGGELNISPAFSAEIKYD